MGFRAAGVGQHCLYFALQDAEVFQEHFCTARTAAASVQQLGTEWLQGDGTLVFGHEASPWCTALSALATQRWKSTMPAASRESGATSPAGLCTCVAPPQRSHTRAVRRPAAAPRQPLAPCAARRSGANAAPVALQVLRPVRSCAGRHRLLRRYHIPKGCWRREHGGGPVCE